MAMPGTDSTMRHPDTGVPLSADGRHVLVTHSGYSAIAYRLLVRNLDLAEKQADQPRQHYRLTKSGHVLIKRRQPRKRALNRVTR